MRASRARICGSTLWEGLGLNNRVPRVPLKGSLKGFYKGTNTIVNPRKLEHGFRRIGLRASGLG